MKKQRKIDTLGLIQKMAEKNKKTVDVLEELKNERVPSKSTLENKQHSERKSVKKKDETTAIGNSKPQKCENAPEGNGYAVQKFEQFLKAESFRDRKESFVLSLSRECMAKYEKLAQGASYKLEIKTHRNDLMRKVLEDFIQQKFRKLLNLIEQE
ncbi:MULTISPECIES: hypothetical protein [Flavobacteriaceae]|jgi:hypothetical protein|uniref:Uncharacterized protein n=3 Tax=Flavobacteriaceae TaxID=49546 RepID=A0A223VAF6_9FLAO|nr:MULTISPECIES: hypothetical protein [Flavobacteriaceae]ASV32363.1 hypothetical protein CJ263_20200 [Maribacter cobaltidurans]MDC6388710.1 hypothetical protein [Maribacter sp. PR1]MEE1976099.1 hypothetical protein [Maribacter cobaltidurans]RIV68971.1 hypothetical protein D2U88_17570 [Allomuricauda aequoris]TXK00680.1 hypothetical protein FQ019_17365 [Allomuricauda aequoris]